MRGSSETKSTIVEGWECRTRPASRTRGTRLPSCATTSSAERPPARPERFALVPVNGQLAPRPSARTNAERGNRTATVPVPAVTASGTSSRAGSTSVSGPGQKRSAKGPNALGRRRTIRSRRASESISKRIGLDSGRPLTRNRFCTARQLDALASSPYRVSVGAATTWPRRIASDARHTAFRWGRPPLTGTRAQIGTG